MAVYIVTLTLSQNKHNITEETLYLSVVEMSIIQETRGKTQWFTFLCQLKNLQQPEGDYNSKEKWDAEIVSPHCAIGTLL